MNKFFSISNAVNNDIFNFKELIILKTLHFEIITGIQKGYKNLIPNYADTENIVSHLWQKNALAEYEKSNIYVSAVIKRCYTVYHEERGCPKGGERTVSVSGVPIFQDECKLDEWKEAVIRLAKKLKEDLEQEYMTCEFMKTELLSLE